MSTRHLRLVTLRGGRDKCHDLRQENRKGLWAETLGNMGQLLDEEGVEGVMLVTTDNWETFDEQFEGVYIEW